MVGLRKIIGLEHPLGVLSRGIIMNVLHTARLAGINIFDYLTLLQKHTDEVKARPDRWLPWNYSQTVASLAT